MEDTFPLLDVSQEQETNHHNIGTEDLFHTHVGTEFSTSASVSPGELCSVDSVEHVLLVPSIFSDCYNLPSLPLWYSLICLWGENLMEASNLEFHRMWTDCGICTCSNLVPEEAFVMISGQGIDLWV